MTLFCLCAEGYGPDWTPSGPEDRETMLKTGLWVRVHDIPSIMADDSASTAVRFFGRWKRMGMPYGAWALNPNPLVEVVDLLEPFDRFYNPPLRI